MSPGSSDGDRVFFPTQGVVRLVLLWSVVACAASRVIGSVAAAEASSTKAASTSAAFDHEKLTSRIQAAIERAKPACVAVSERRRSGRGATFSAVIVSREGHILTAGHCIKPKTMYQVTLYDGAKLEAEGLGRSPHLDCGLMKIVGGSDFSWVELGRSAELARDQPCLSISHPGGFNGRRGLVVRFGRVLGTNSRGHIHNTCLMEPGDSGGGLFDLSGRVIGIHSYIAKSLEDNFDIPVDCFRDHWDQLCEAKEFDPPRVARNSGIVLQAHQTMERGAEVADVVAESPAEEAGLLAGDVITVVNGTKLDRRFRVGRMLRHLLSHRDRDLNLTVLRQNSTHAVVIKKDVPPSYAAVSYATDEYEYLSDLSERFSTLEDSLDDCTVRVVSRQNNKNVSLLGTVLSRDGLILSKSSRVGRSPTVVDPLGQRLSAQVVARDKENDLVLLRVEGWFPLALEQAAPGERLEGTMLLSPRPGEANGLVSVVGSKRFNSPAGRQPGHLGVTLEMREGEVALKDVTDGAGKAAGLRPGDIVLALDDESVTSIDGMIAAVQSHKPAEEVRLTIQRAEVKETINVVLGLRSSGGIRHVADDFAGGPSLRKAGFEAVFCHDAHAKPDECGGPVFDAAGNFVGINIARVSRTRCYALPADIVEKTVDRLKKKIDLSNIRERDHVDR